MSELANNGMMDTQIDEKWMDEWVEYGIQQFNRSLLMHARFDKYLQEHETQEPES